MVERHLFQEAEGGVVASPPLAQQESNSEFGVEVGGAPRPPLGAQAEPPGEEPALLVQPQLVYGVDVDAAPALYLQEDHVAKDPEVVDPLDPGTQFN